VPRMEVNLFLKVLNAGPEHAAGWTSGYLLRAGLRPETNVTDLCRERISRQHAAEAVERETGIEPATSSLGRSKKFLARPFPSMPCAEERSEFRRALRHSAEGRRTDTNLSAHAVVKLPGLQPAFVTRRTGATYVLSENKTPAFTGVKP
jgi:hypothetical protein